MYDFLLNDRIGKIREIDEKYDLNSNGALSFSGGKDSVALSRLLDVALPSNSIPRVYINTGIEYGDMIRFVRSIEDERIVIVNPIFEIGAVLKHDGYPFKSKEFSQLLGDYQKHGMKKHTLRYLDGVNVSDKLRRLFSNEFDLKVSSMCCERLKKTPFRLWMSENERSITITGIRYGEGGVRKNSDCLGFSGERLTRFNPLFPCDDVFIDTFIQNEGIRLCRLYYPPFSFKRTGCKGCPFNINIGKDLTKIRELLPNEYRQCLRIWKPVYEKYIKLNYRIKENLYE